MYLASRSLITIINIWSFKLNLKQENRLVVMRSNLLKDKHSSAPYALIGDA